jgi:PhnB protein
MEKKSKSSKGSVAYRPEGSHTITPYLVVDGAAKFIEFAKKAFDAKLISNTKADDGKIVNAMVEIGDSAIMVSDLMHGMNTENAMLYLYVKDVDATHGKAVDAGAQILQPVKDQFYGDRAGAIKDSWGNKWWIATHNEDVSDQELQKRSNQALGDEKKRSKLASVDN